MLVQKKNGTSTLYIGYRVLDNISVWKRYMIPQIYDLLDKLKGSIYFSNINLMSGYHYVPIQPSNVWNDTFNSMEGHFEWLIMPFRLTNALTTLISLMDDRLKPFSNSIRIFWLFNINEMKFYLCCINSVFMFIIYFITFLHKFGSMLLERSPLSKYFFACPQWGEDIRS